MTYYSPLWVFDGEVTTSTEVANFKMEDYSENTFAHVGNWTSVTRAEGKNVDH